MSTTKGDPPLRRAWPYLAVAVGLLGWLWPIGLGGAMPVGGDVTQFSMGLMAVLRRSLRSGHLPLWNDLWGYGFPGLAESQMGVLYPPHWILYGLLPVEAAYTAGLVLHTVACGLGATWAARRFGVSGAGALLAGWSWAASGSFVIHLPHQWGYTTASWMPWIWGLGWTVLRGEGGRRHGLLLAAALALQILPGHFQIAFMTQAGLLLLALVGRPGWHGLGAMALAGLGAAPLAAGQLVPTARLAALARGDRTFEYLGTFATTPLHLISYLAPGLFHRSPLWRPVVWDPLHAIPEESAGYVGLAALALAIVAVRRGWKADPAVRALFVLAVAMTALSLGPYVPGFGVLIRLPGFSFFRAPARWEVGAGLALALLAGKGFDRIGAWARPSRSLSAFAIGAVVPMGLVVAGFELALAGTAVRGGNGFTAAIDRVLTLTPWSARPTVAAMMAEARRPQAGLRERAGLAREGYRAIPPEGLSLEQERFGIYRRELAGTAAVVLGLLLIAALAARPAGRRLLPGALLVLSAVDLLLLGRQRTVETMPLRPLGEVSPVLARLAMLPPGTRTLDPLRNLPMVAGVAPVSAYRTLDLPRPTALDALAVRSGPDEPIAAAALRASGAGVRILDPFEAIGRRDVEILDDPALASWLYGSAWVAGEGGRWTRFGLWSPGAEPSRTWRLPAGVVPDDRGGPAAILAALERAEPLTSRAPDPEHREVSLTTTGAATVLLSIQFDPAWRATWEDGSTVRTVALRSAFGGWTAAEVPGPGDGTLRLAYDPREVRPALAASALAWLGWFLCWFRWRRKKGAT